MKSFANPFRPARGFTLIELLTVIAIIGILAAIIIPTTGAVRTAAKKSQTKAQFSNWATAMALYKQEYGYFPPVNRGTYGSSAVNRVDPEAFAIALTGKRLDGTEVSGTSAADLYGNKKKMSFYSITDNDLNEARNAIRDAFDNTEIAVIYDRDANGMITNADLDSGSAAPTVNGLAPDTGMTGTSGPRASVIFYSAGKGQAENDIVYSWK